MENTTEKGNLISNALKVIILLLKVLAIIFVIIGTVSLFKAVFKTVAFDKYPLQDYQLTTTGPKGESVAKPESELQIARKLRMLEDYSGALTLLLLAGGVALLIRKKTE